MRRHWLPLVLGFLEEVSFANIRICLFLLYMHAVCYNKYINFTCIFGDVDEDDQELNAVCAQLSMVTLNVDDEEVEDKEEEEEVELESGIWRF